MMDMEISESHSVEQDDTLMETGQAPVQHIASGHTVQAAQPMDDASSSVGTGMDVDSHMMAAQAAPTIEQSSVEHHNAEQSASVPSTAVNSERSIVESGSPMGHAEPASSSRGASDTEDRIDAILAGKDDNEDGYESSDLESSDDDEPDSSDSDSDSDTEMGAKGSAMTIEQREKALIEIDAMDDDDEATPSDILHTANEIIQLPEVKKPDIVLGPDVVLEPIGTVMSIVDNVVVVQAASSGEVRVLDAGTITAVMKPKDGEKETEVLGEIFETFGPVARPLYSIRFNTASEIPAVCTMGCTVYSAPEYSSFVMTEPLKALKGSDASNKFDEEVDEVEMEFSDDEKEMEHKRLLKQQRNQKKGAKDRKVPIMAADTSAAMQAMMGETPSASSSSPSSAPQNRRKPIALPRRPRFDEPEDGYRILQRPGAKTQPAHGTPQALAGSSTIPWYQQQQRELQNMMGISQKPSVHNQQQKEQEAILQFQKQQQIQQGLLLQQQQQQQLYQQQQQQQEAYQKQIQEAQATILRLQQQQQQLQQQHQQQQYSPQQPPTFAPMNASFHPQQVHSQLSIGHTPQQLNDGGQQHQQQIMNMLSPLFPPQNQQQQQPQ
ncbi:hypothetical protein EDD11_002305 [Mortierella claussenii]|nr:hypothetical protein EDD11_002305 [Mortierella claussenii]